MKTLFITLCIFVISLMYILPTSAQNTTAIEMDKSEKKWKQDLTPEEYRILRDCGTEPAFTGKYYQHKETGIYVCAGCGTELFSSDTKYDSGSGWPSFYAPVGKNTIKEVEDTTFGMRRIEIKCAKCDGHLGHVFPDGPKQTGLRYCVNSVSLEFKKVEE